tara:strand:- start:63 stop:2129 length:2067 start_codon:yes stop_codon:yes gene_type:complete
MGGGVLFEGGTSSDFYITDAVIVDNVAGVAHAGGAGIFCTGGNSYSFVNVMISGNEAQGTISGQGGGIFIQNASPHFTNVTLSDNMASHEGSGVFCDNGANPIFSNTILWNDTSQEILFSSSNDPNSITISNSNIQGGQNAIVANDNGTITWGEGNIDADPLFCEPDSGNYHIAGNSPCAGTGLDGADMGALGVGCDAILFPPVVSIPDTSMNEDSEFFYDLSAYISDVDDDTLMVVVGHVSQPMRDHVQVQMIGPDTLRLVSRNNWNGSGTIMIRVNDGQTETHDPFMLTVNPVNDAPVFENLSALVGVGMEFEVPIHVSDVDMDQLEVSFDSAWEYPVWLSLASDPYRLVGTAPNQGLLEFPVHLTDRQVTVTDTFSILAAFFHPRITSIRDVPDDQGGRVYIDFRRSFFDRPNLPNDLYTIFRRDMIDNTPDWVVVGSGAAIGDNTYTYEVATLRDSTAVDDGMTMYKVVASMNEGDFHSPPHTGYSIDNIAPGVPTGMQLVANHTTITVSWDISGDDDFQYFLLERSTNTDFTANEIVTIEMVDTVYTDEAIDLGQEYFYRLAALDHAGNKSEYTQAMSATALGIDPSSLIPDVFAMHQNYPNPFNPVTQIRYDLPEDSYVSINIYDIMGRNIKSLVNTDQTAGYRSVRWNATNDLGDPVSAGMYIYMIQAGEFRQTKKMVLMK